MIFSKTIPGYVIQRFNSKGEFLYQEFVPIEDIEYARDGETIKPCKMPLHGKEAFPFNMLQNDSKTRERQSQHFNFDDADNEIKKE